MFATIVWAHFQLNISFAVTYIFHDHNGTWTLVTIYDIEISVKCPNYFSAESVF